MMGLNLFQLLNGLTFAALLFIVASGFTLIFGLLRIVNLGHRLISSQPDADRGELD